MDFSLEEAFDLMIELVMMSGFVGVMLFYFVNMHKFQ